MRRVWITAGLCLALIANSTAAIHEKKKPTTNAAAGVVWQPAGMMQALRAVDDERIRRDVRELSSDRYEGRGTGAPGGELAADYIANEFRRAGVAPAGDDGSYFQKVPMVGVTTLPQTTFSLATPKRRLTLRLLDDVVVWNQEQVAQRTVQAPVVFLGYGITAPEFNWDDYAGIDVKGKILLMLVNEPPSNDPKFFAGKALTYYGRWTYKLEQATRRGALGVILIHKTDMASYGWEVVRSSWSGERSELDGANESKLALAGWIQFEQARAALADCGQDLDTLIAAAQQRGFRAVALPLTVDANLVSSIRRFTARNVVAKVTGSDPALRQQAIFYTAHYDHLGMRPAQPANVIYHGMVDNATGTAMILEMARAAAATREKPRRSLYFAAVTAEEQGLWGSDWLGQHSPVPLRDVSLALNFDAIKPLGIPREVEAEGYERTTIGPIFEHTAADFKMKILAPRHPEDGDYYRSDHFNFAKFGVPAFSVEPGERFTGHPEAWVRARSQQMDASYHQPSDEYRAEYDFRSNAVLARFGLALGYRVAALPGLLGWRAGDEFEPARQTQERQR